MADDAVKTVAGEITKIAVEHGYDGAAPKTITGAIDALADTLAGSDVDSGQTVAQAVRALAPYIGSGGGGGSLGNGYSIGGFTGAESISASDEPMGLPPSGVKFSAEPQEGGQVIIPAGSDAFIIVPNANYRLYDLNAEAEYESEIKTDSFDGVTTYYLCFTMPEKELWLEQTT